MIFYLVILITISVLILFFSVRHGFRIGFAKEVTTMLALLAGALAVSLLSSLAGRLQKQDTGGVITGILLLVLFGLIFRVVHLILTSINLIARLPVINWLNKGLGLLSGFVCGFVILYVLELLIRNYLLA